MLGLAWLRCEQHGCLCSSDSRTCRWFERGCHPSNNPVITSRPWCLSSLGSCWSENNINCLIWAMQVSCALALILWVSGPQIKGRSKIHLLTQCFPLGAGDSWITRLLNLPYAFNSLEIWWPQSHLFHIRSGRRYLFFYTYPFVLVSRVAVTPP